MIGKQGGVFIIAEAGVNHNGSPELALDLVDAAAAAGADAVKFQTFKTGNILVKDAPMADYQERNLGQAKSQYEMVEELELAYSDFSRIQSRCAEMDIRFLSTPDDEESLAFLLSIGMDLIKVGSGEVENIPFLRRIGSCRKDVILSTGMSTLGEVERARSTLLAAGAKSVAILHCTTSYPCPMQDVNLRAMVTLEKAFKAETGYSDHTNGIEVAVAAVALGARIIEKHFTLDKTMRGPDHAASLDPGELKAMVQSIRNVESCLGSGIKQPTAGEIANSKAVRRSVVARTPIPMGSLLTEDNLAVKRAGGKGIPASLWDMVLGRAAIKDYAVDDLVDF